MEIQDLCGGRVIRGIHLHYVGDEVVTKITFFATEHYLIVRADGDKKTLIEYHDGT